MNLSCSRRCLAFALNLGSDRVFRSMGLNSLHIRHCSQDASSKNCLFGALVILVLDTAAVPWKNMCPSSLPLLLSSSQTLCVPPVLYVSMWLWPRKFYVLYLCFCCSRCHRPGVCVCPQ
ncbi:hypothetical protein DUNSADRAFT_10573 [Dunaliella salina]|uniref:Encoded protein n=1 Tax=Dunaliella salina TaxID=3046 RepID=A0ABQ7H4S7_DUNSA|nr:hypothetical protein DUNSADRAFT_10573 [Dunaliella salina]|eukprot:KAF5841868.1 hypothetical protein DUNSADRAFT_10573 [Dunaliella salina]